MSRIFITTRDVVIERQLYSLNNCANIMTLEHDVFNLLKAMYDGLDRLILVMFEGLLSRHRMC